MEIILLRSSMIAQIDVFKNMSTFLSDYMVYILGGIVGFVFLMLLFSKKMSAKPTNKNFSSKTTSKQGQYKKFK
ncbi:MAG: hypothetical protein IC227_06420 [Enterococcus lacertideformus]|uniref:Uncharacterized protein n=1 Tax=Enterococcus lacertideformus TaxID=2771493 RepID=A0A931AZ43_9ENTE|nr:hypothetical protein [Enterococcus lacertideformus]